MYIEIKINSEYAKVLPWPLRFKKDNVAYFHDSSIQINISLKADCK